MSHIEVYIHFVWSTKNREKLLPTKQIRKTVWNHIKENGREKGIYILIPLMAIQITATVWSPWEMIKQFEK